MQKLIILGDSVLKGVTYDSEADRYRLYGSTLQKRLEPQGIEVRQYCRMGATIRDGKERLAAMIAGGEDLSGTQLLLEFGGNDCDHDWACVAEAPDKPHFPKTPLPLYLSLCEETVTLARQHGIAVTVATLVPIHAENYFAFISRGRCGEGILRWLGDTSMLYRWHESYNSALVLLAEALRCPLLDLRTPFLCSHEFPALLSADGVHPSIRGHRMIEDLLVSAFGTSGE